MYDSLGNKYITLELDSEIQLHPHNPIRSKTYIYKNGIITYWVDGEILYTKIQDYDKIFKDPINPEPGF